MKEKVLDILYRLGFEPEEMDGDWGYKFDYEDLTLLYCPEDGKSETLVMMVPSIYEITEENKAAVQDAAMRLCGKMRFVQPAIMFGSSLWLNYQHFLGDVEPTEDLVAHMVRVLAVSTVNFHKIINHDDYDE